MIGVPCGPFFFLVDVVSWVLVERVFLEVGLETLVEVALMPFFVVVVRILVEVPDFLVEVETFLVISNELAMATRAKKTNILLTISIAELKVD